jgi:hypothetical protein
MEISINHLNEIMILIFLDISRLTATKMKSLRAQTEKLD